MDKDCCFNRDGGLELHDRWLATVRRCEQRGQCRLSKQDTCPLSVQWQYLFLSNVSHFHWRLHGWKFLEGIVEKDKEHMRPSLSWCRFLWRILCAKTMNVYISFCCTCSSGERSYEKGYIRDALMKTGTFSWNISTNQKNRFALADYQRTITRIITSAENVTTEIFPLCGWPHNAACLLDCPWIDKSWENWKCCCKLCVCVCSCVCVQVA